MDEQEEIKSSGWKQRLKGNVWFRIAKNKYILTVAFFLVWMMFFDNNNWFYLGKLTEEAEAKQKEKAYYKKEIEDSERKLYELTSNMKELEKFGRENYYMKKSNEDIFVFFPAETEKK